MDTGTSWCPFIDEGRAAIDWRGNLAPCSNYGDCELVEMNNTDCYGNPFPTYGDCLYARGLVRCP